MTRDPNLRAIATVDNFYTVLNIKDERDFEAVNRRLRSMALNATRVESSHHYGVTDFAEPSPELHGPGPSSTMPSQRLQRHLHHWKPRRAR